MPPGVSPLIYVGLGIAVIALFVVMFLLFGRKKSTDKRKTGLNTKNREQALRDATKKLSQNPKDAGALSIIGDHEFNSGNWEKAMLAYATLIEAAASHSEVDEFEANMRYGISAVNLKRFEEAYQGLSVALALKPDVFEVTYNLGNLEYQRKQYERASGLLRSALEKNPDHLESRKLLGLCHFKQKRYKEAVENLKVVIDHHMDDKESIYYLASSYFENGQLEMAVSLFSHLRPDPNFGPQASLMAGSIHLKAKQYDEAQLDFEIGLKHKQMKKDVLLELRYRLANTLMKKQEITEALKHLRGIYEIDPGYKDVAAQIQSNQELSRNENLQTYLIGSPSDFVSICRRMVSGFFSKARTRIVDIQVTNSDYADILAEVETPAWEDTIVFRFVRGTGVIGEFILRDLYAKIKDLKAGRGFCITAGSFSDTASKFVEARSIDLVDKDGLLKSLNKLQKLE